VGLSLTDHPPRRIERLAPPGVRCQRCSPLARVHAKHIRGPLSTLRTPCKRQSRCRAMTMGSDRRLGTHCRLTFWDPRSGSSLAHAGAKKSACPLSSSTPSSRCRSRCRSRRAMVVAKIARTRPLTTLAARTMAARQVGLAMTVVGRVDRVALAARRVGAARTRRSTAGRFPRVRRLAPGCPMFLSSSPRSRSRRARRG